MAQARKRITRKWGFAMHSLTLGIFDAVYSGPNASKRMAQDAGTSHRTCEKWIARLTTPRADTVLAMAMRNDELRAELVRRLEGHGYDAGKSSALRSGVVTEVDSGSSGAVGGLDRSPMSRSGTPGDRHEEIKA